MSEIINTQLRFVSSKDAERIAVYCNTLGYKVEIKGNPFFNPKDKKWYLWFIIPDIIDSKLEAVSGDLD